MQDGTEGAALDGVSGVQHNGVVGDDATREGARATEDELARARLGQRARAREATIDGHVLRARGDGQVSEAVGDVDRLSDGAGEGRTELQRRGGRAAREVQVSTRAEGGRVTEDDRTTEEVGIAGVGIDAIEDNRAAVGRTKGKLTAGGTRARTGSDDGIHGQGCGRIWSQDAQAVNIQRQAAVSVEGDVGRGAEDTPVKGEAIGREGSRRGTECGGVADDDGATIEAQLTRVAGTSGEGQGTWGRSGARLVQLTVAEEWRGECHVEARGIDSHWRIDRELREREARGGTQVELETTAVEDQATGRHGRGRIDAEHAAVDNDAGAGGGAAGEGEHTRRDHGVAGVGIGTREEQRAGTRLGEARSARDHTRDVHRGTRTEIRHVERRVDVEGDVLGKGQRAVEFRG